MYEDNRNWNLYNRRLGERGKVISLFLHEKADLKRELEEINKMKRGRPFKYPASLIEAGFNLKCLFHFGYRQIENFMKDVCRFLHIQVPNFRTLWWRINEREKQSLNVNIPEGKCLNVAVDATGLKMSNDGEYRTAKYGKIKVWVKLHSNVNISTHEVVNIEITKNDVGDSKRFKALIEPIKDSINSVHGDKGYDTQRDFEYCELNGIQAIIPVKANAKPSGRGARQKAVREQFDIPPTHMRLSYFDRPKRREQKQQEWKNKTHYGKRWAVEGFYSRYKRLFGEYVFSKKWDNIQKEIVTKVNLLNLFIKMR